MFVDCQNLFAHSSLEELLTTQCDRFSKEEVILTTLRILLGILHVFGSLVPLLTVNEYILECSAGVNYSLRASEFNNQWNS